MKKLNIKLPLRKVKLPTFNKTKKYYEQIDKNLIYSNNGPLVRQLKKSLAEKFNIDQNYLTITSNGTVSLKTILRAIIELKLEMGQIHEKNFSDLYCLVPSFTFVASAMSIIESGLQPIFIDIEGDNGLISPITVKRFLEKKIVDRDKIIAIMPVSPFGAKINKNQWVEFKNEHDIEIVYDEAWCFDSFNDVSLSPSAISLHASKSFGCGEGGLIISKDTEITNHCKKFINFGFDNNKISQIVGTNGKMSEYNAAVALANLDEWPENKSNCINLQKYYLKKIKTFSNIKVMDGFNNSFVWGTLPIIINNFCNINDIILSAAEHNIEFRSWWKNGIHNFPAMKNFKCDDLNNTFALTNKLVNIPFFPQMSKDEIDFVCEFLKKYD